MARNFETLRQTMGADRLEKNAEQAAALLAAMSLTELRGALQLTQEEMAQRLSIAQSNVSRLERRHDMLVSTLRQVVRALGGELRISAVFPDGVIEINQFLTEEAVLDDRRAAARGGG